MRTLTGSTHIFKFHDFSRLVATLINWWRCVVMDCPCAELGDFSFSSFGFIMQTDRQHNRGSTLYSRDYRQRE